MRLTDEQFCALEKVFEEMRTIKLNKAGNMSVALQNIVRGKLGDTLCALNCRTCSGGLYMCVCSLHDIFVQDRAERRELAAKFDAVVRGEESIQQTKKMAKKAIKKANK